MEKDFTTPRASFASRFHGLKFLPLAGRCEEKPKDEPTRFRHARNRLSSNRASCSAVMRGKESWSAYRHPYHIQLSSCLGKRWRFAPLRHPQLRFGSAFLTKISHGRHFSLLPMNTTCSLLFSSACVSVRSSSRFPRPPTRI